MINRYNFLVARIQITFRYPQLFNPFVGEEKSLEIEYRYSGKHETIKIKDNEPLRLPLNASNAS